MPKEAVLALLISAFALIFIIITISFVCFIQVFYSPKRKPKGENDFPLPEGDIYKPLHEGMIKWMKIARSMPRERLEIKSHDNLTLVGYYYEFKPDAPIEILFHGYRGDGERDLAGGIERCFKIGRSAIIIDQRAHGESEGSIITFGIKERIDCISWVEYVIKKFGSDVKIILTGVSMGAATVMMAAGEALPKNVVSVLADCGYTSPCEIIKKVIKDMHLPAGLLYPFVKLGALIFGKFNLEELSPIEAMKRTSLPVIFIHGDDDDFVPHDMSCRLYESCAARHKKMVTINGAGHGIAYPTNKELYLKSLCDFENETGFLK